MANFADVSPIDAIARRLASRIPLSAPRARSTRLFYEALIGDERCVRRLSKREAEEAPDWARRALQSGLRVSAFEAHAEAITELRRIARHVKDACAEYAFLAAAPRQELSTHAVVIRQLAAEFVDKIERMPLATVAEKARFFSRERALRRKEAKANEPLFNAEAICAAPGRTWRRIISVGQLSSIGREFGNCLAKATRHHLSYARRLKLDQARFWVLRDHVGTGRMVAMVETATARLVEARGVRNAPVSLEDPDLTILLRASALRALKALADERALAECSVQPKDDRL
jgi:hypothetical protein